MFKKIKEYLQILSDLNKKNDKILKDLKVIKRDLGDIESELIVEKIEETDQSIITDLQKQIKSRDVYIKTLQQDLKDIVDAMKRYHHRSDKWNPSSTESIQEKDIEIQNSNQLLILQNSDMLSHRTKNALSNAQIDTIQELIYLKEIDVMKIKGLGKKWMHEIKQLLKEMNLYFN